MTTENRLKIFKEIVQDAIDERSDQDIYHENRPDEEYDYEAFGEEEPEDIDPDNTFYGDTDETIRDMMFRKINEAFKPGWEKE